MHTDICVNVLSFSRLMISPTSRALNTDRSPYVHVFIMLIRHINYVLNTNRDKLLCCFELCDPYYCLAGSPYRIIHAILFKLSVIRYHLIYDQVDLDATLEYIILLHKNSIIAASGKKAYTEKVY